MTRGSSQHFSCFYDVLLREIKTAVLTVLLLPRYPWLYMCVWDSPVCVLYCVRVRMCQCSVDVQPGSWYKNLV